MPITITSVSLTGLPDRAEPLGLRHLDADVGTGPEARLPLRVEPNGQLFLIQRVRLAGAACTGPLLTGAQIRYRVAGITRTDRLVPVSQYTAGLGCR